MFEKSQTSPNITLMTYFSQFWVFLWFLDLWSPDMTPYATPDAIWMIILSLGHSIVYVTIRNLILCKGYMACYVQNMFEIAHFRRFFAIFGDLSIYHSISYSLVSRMFYRSFYQSIWEKLVRNDMPHPVFIPRIPKSTLLVNFSLRVAHFRGFSRLFRDFHIRKL